jgi:hypothetical protein
MQDTVYEPQEEPKVRAVYDLGPGGKYRRNTEGGTPVVFEKLKGPRDGRSTSRFVAYDEYMNSKVKFRPKPEEQEKTQKKSTQPVVITESLYDILQVPVNCSAADLKVAFRQLALTNHPDKGGDSTVFDKIKTAYDVLSNPKIREVYDEDGIKGVELMNPEFDSAKFTQS